MPLSNYHPVPHFSVVLTGVFYCSVCGWEAYSHGRGIGLGEVSGEKGTAAMKEVFAARNMFVPLAVLAGAVAALVWWLFVSGYPGAPSESAKRETPVESGKRASEKSASPAVAAATEAIKGLTDQLGALKPDQPDSAPKFDVARIEQNGEAVIAGHAAPGASVELLQDGKVHDRTVADSSGAFVFVPQPLPSGNYNLTLRTIEPDGKVTVSKGAVAVTLSFGSKQEKPLAALAAPKAPSIVLAKPAADPEPRIQIDAVEAEGGGRLRVAGRSAPGSIVRLYLNDAYIATGTASPDGRVAFSILGGVKPGEYRIRLDQMNAAGGVLSRLESAFNAPATVAEAKSSEIKSSSPSEPATALRKLGSSPASSPSTEAPSRSANAAEKNISPSITTTPPVTGEVVATGSTDQRSVVVVPNINTKAVVRGDNLWRISQATYGHGKRYTEIYTANRAKIRNPDLIYPDQIFVLPSASPQ